MHASSILNDGLHAQKMRKASLSQIENFDCKNQKARIQLKGPRKSTPLHHALCANYHPHAC